MILVTLFSKNLNAEKEADEGISSFSTAFWLTAIRTMVDEKNTTSMQFSYLSIFNEVSMQQKIQKSPSKVCLILFVLFH